MLLLSFVYIIQIVFILRMNPVDSQVFSSSAAKARRSQSMRHLTRIPEASSNTQSASSSASSTSSLMSLTQANMDIKIKPITASSSSTVVDVLPTGSKDHQKLLKPCISECLHEIDLNPAPVADDVNQRRSSLLASLHEGTLGTHSGGNLDPARHGYFARMRNALREHGVAAGVGTAVGIGGVQLVEHLYSGSTMRAPVSTSTEMSSNNNNSAPRSNDDVDGITDLL